MVRRTPNRLLVPFLNRPRALLVCSLLVGLVSVSFAHEPTRPKLSAVEKSIQTAQADRAVVNRPAHQDSCRLTLRLTDAQTGKTIPGHIRLVTDSGQVVPLPQLLNRGTKLPNHHPARQWYALTGESSLNVPKSKLTVTAFSGLETEVATAEVDLRDKTEAVLKIPFTRFYNAQAQGQYAGNTHLHLMKMTREQADRYLREIPVVDGLDLVFVSYLERAEADKHYISNTYTKQALENLASVYTRFGNGEEHRHNFGPGGEGYGHVMLLNIRELIQPVSIGPGIMQGQGTDGISLRRGIRKARQDGASVI